MQKSSELSGDPQKILMCPSCLNPLRFKEDNGTTKHNQKIIFIMSKSMAPQIHDFSSNLGRSEVDQWLAPFFVYFTFFNFNLKMVVLKGCVNLSTIQNSILPGLTLIFSGWNSLIFGVKIQVLENVAGFLSTKIEMFLVMVLTCD